MVSDKLPQNEHVDEKENQTGNPYVDHGVTALKLQIVCWGEPDGLQKPHQINKQTNKQTNNRGQVHSIQYKNKCVHYIGDDS